LHLILLQELTMWKQSIMILQEVLIHTHTVAKYFTTKNGQFSFL